MTHEHNKRLLLGAHMSISGNMAFAFDRAESIGCTTMQIFSKNSRQWHAKPISTEDALTFKKRAQHSTVYPVIIHTSYLINVGAHNPEIEKKSIESLELELQRCEQLAIPYLVLHPGTAGSAQSTEECLERIARNLTDTFKRCPGKAIICIENMAGHGSSVGHTFEQLAFIRDRVTPKERIGFCFDTCHAFAAGYDLRTASSYNNVWKEFDRIIGLSNLKVIHLNDSKKDFNSHVDRHEEVGKGTLGLEAFRLLMNDERLFDVPKILETPRDTLEDYAHNMTILKELLSEKTRKILNV